MFADQVIDVQRVVLSFNSTAALLAYVVLLFGLYWFVIRVRASVLDAALLGALINGTYELTNMTMFKKWHWETVVIDTLWGAFLWGFVAYAVRHPIHLFCNSKGCSSGS